jgi:hypothetical protein
MSDDGLSVPAPFGTAAAITDRPTDEAFPPRSTRPFRRIASLGAITALILAACGSSSGSSSTGASATSGASAPGVASPEASPSASAPARIIIQVVPENNSKISGGAILSDLGDGSSAVTVGVIAIGVEDPMPAEIEAGSCADLVAAAPSAAPGSSASPAPSAAPSAVPSVVASAGASESAGPSASVNPNGPFPLKDISGGSSNTVVPVSLSNLLAQPFAIVIHASATDPTIVACADITAAGIPVPSGLESAIPSLLPSLPAASSSPS